MSKLTEVIGRIRFLIWVYSYRLTKLVKNKLGNAQLDSLANRVNDNTILLNRIGRTIDYINSSVGCIYDRANELEERIEKLERKIKLLSKKEKKDARPKKRISISKKRS